MEKKPSTSFSFFFKKLNKRSSSNGGVSRRWKPKISTGFRWNRKFSLYHWLVDGFIFKIVSIFEAVVLVAKLAFFFLCCGCRF